MDDKLVERRSEPRIQVDKYYSVEFAIDGIDVAYQFKIWNIASSSMSVLIREDSAILPRLKVGDILNVKYYAKDSPYASEVLRTAIRHVTKNDEGRLKGHYLVGLEILEGKDSI
jgi:hypothetical protein